MMTTRLYLGLRWQSRALFKIVMPASKSEASANQPNSISILTTVGIEESQEKVPTSLRNVVKKLGTESLSENGG
jgi:hypothetical protein